jgi:spermidine synthase
MKPPPKEGRITLLLGVSLLSASLLALEVLFVRLVSILLYPVSTYLVISLALLGFGVGGTALALRRSPKPLSAAQAGAASIAFAVAVALALVDLLFAGQSPVAAALLPIALSLPFACGGLAIALALSLPGTSVHRVYFADLLGAGLGAAGILIAIEPLGGIRLGMLIAGLGLVAGGLFASTRKTKGAWGWCVLGVGSIVLSLLIHVPRGIVPIASKELALFTRLGPEVEWEYQGWSPMARVDVLSLPGDQVELPEAFEYKLVTQDGGAPSILLHMPDVRSADFTDHTLFGLPYWIKSGLRVLIIGLGGGPDVQAALHYGATSITGVEINPQMIDIARDHFADFVGHPYADPRVTIIEGDGRHVTRLSDERYDIIQLTGVDTSVAALGGNPNLAENYLYTVEAFREFYQHLTPEGTFSVSFPHVPGLGLRLMATASAALRAEGLNDPGQHLVVSTTGGFAHVLVKRSPFAATEIATIQEHFASPMMGLYFPLYHRLFGTPDAEFFARNEILYAPSLEIPGPHADFMKAFQARRERGFLAAQPQTVFPPTDDWPFFFVLDKWGHQVPNLLVLAVTIALLFAVSAVFILAPPIILRRSGLFLPKAPSLVLYFAALGLGYIFVEVVFIQKLSLFLGHPSYALAVTLCTLLISSGLGSLLGGRSDDRQSSVDRRRRVRLAATGVALLTFAAAVGLDSVYDLLLRWPLALRVLVSVVIVALPGFLMGIPFPTGLADVKAHTPAFVPWAWAINSTATVIGTVTAVMLAMLFGFTIVFVCAGALYLLSAFSGSVAFGPR